MSIEVEKATRENVSYKIEDETGDAKDLTQAQDVIMRVNHDLNTEDQPVIEKSAGTTNADGVAVWNFDDTETDIATGLYRFEIEILYSNDQSTTPVSEGYFYVRKRVQG